MNKIALNKLSHKMKKDDLNLATRVVYRTWIRSNSLRVGDFVRQDFADPTEQPHIGVVSHLFPLCGEVNVEFPWGNQRLAAHHLIKQTTQVQPTFIEPSHYPDFETERSERLFGTVEDALADRIIR